MEEWWADGADGLIGWDEVGSSVQSGSRDEWALTWRRLCTRRALSQGLSLRVRGSGHKIFTPQAERCSSLTTAMRGEVCRMITLSSGKKQSSSSIPPSLSLSARGFFLALCCWLHTSSNWRTSEISVCCFDVSVPGWTVSVSGWWNSAAGRSVNELIFWWSFCGCQICWGHRAPERWFSWTQQASLWPSAFRCLSFTVKPKVDALSHASVSALNHLCRTNKHLRSVTDGYLMLPQDQSCC